MLEAATILKSAIENKSCCATSLAMTLQARVAATDAGAHQYMSRMAREALLRNKDAYRSRETKEDMARNDSYLMPSSSMLCWVALSREAAASRRCAHLPFCVSLLRFTVKLRAGGRSTNGPSGVLNSYSSLKTHEVRILFRPLSRETLKVIDALN